LDASPIDQTQPQREVAEAQEAMVEGRERDPEKNRV